MGTEKEIEDFVTKLKNYGPEPFPYVENMYADGTPNTSENLELYLKQMLKQKPKKLIVGEAPGYKGCRRSGIPFTSEKNLVQTTFFKNKGYKIKTPQKPRSEATATAVWNFLDTIEEPLPLIWNAFPFHPYDPKSKNGKNSNRKPNEEELKEGEKILKKLIEIFNIEKDNIIAVGEKAQNSLKTTNYVCHPAARKNGKERFVEDMHKYFH